MAKVVYTNREIIVTGIFVLACFVAVSFFPTEGLFQNLSGMAAFLILGPLLYIKFVLKKSLGEFGAQIGDWREGAWGISTAFLFSAPLLYILINYTDLLQKQDALKVLQGRFSDFLYYEAVFSASIVIMSEIFFRGLIFFGTVRRFGAWSIGIQFVLTCVFIWIAGLFPLGISYYIIIGSLFGGIIAYRSRSLVYGLFFNGLFVLIADAVVIKMLK